MKVIIGGDLVPTEPTINYFINGDINNLLGDSLKRIWESADIRIFNLEIPLYYKENPIDKHGPNLIAPIETIRGIKALDPTLVTLANNHILDQSIQGLHSTIDTLKKHNIDFIGAGDNLANASKPYIIKNDYKTIGIYTCAEHEFTIATEYTPGANPF